MLVLTGIHEGGALDGKTGHLHFTLRSDHPRSPARWEVEIPVSKKGLDLPNTRVNRGAYDWHSPPPREAKGLGDEFIEGKVGWLWRYLQIETPPPAPDMLRRITHEAVIATATDFLKRAETSLNTPARYGQDEYISVGPVDKGRWTTFSADEKHPSGGTALFVVPITGQFQWSYTGAPDPLAVRPSPQATSWASGIYALPSGLQPISFEEALTAYLEIANSNSDPGDAPLRYL